MKKIVLCLLMLCTYMAAISQNPILLNDVYPGATGSGTQQIVKTNNDIFFNAEENDDKDRGLFRTDGKPTGNLKPELSYPTYSYSIKKNSLRSTMLDNWGVVGSATPNGWGGPDMPLTYDANNNTWSAVVSLSTGEIKFRNNNDWSVNYGDNGADGSLDAGGSNIVVTAGNYLITLNFTTWNYSLATSLISIPDPNFEQALIDLGFDKDGVINASILRSDAEAITELNVTGKNISSLQGIEAFINLSRLLCQNNQLQVLNISKNTALTVLECGGNQLTTLNVSKNLLLRVLGFGFNNISAIDVSRNLNLEVFWCNNNQIVSQNLDLNPALTVVGLSNNPLTFVSLKNGNNSKIVYFEAQNTPKLGCINADPVVSVSMINSGKTFSDNCAKAYYVNDDQPTGDILTSAIGNNTNAGTKAAPFATLTYALSQSAEGDTIYVDAGTYVEQVTINNGVTIIGAGQNLTSILKPAVTIAPPGSFLEQGVIQTAQSITGDVHISNLSVTGGLNPGVTPIIIQSGGSVKNCKLQSGSQGIFVRIDPTVNLATKTFVVDGNTINAEYIAVNFAGTRLTATLSNSTLATFNSGFSTAVFAGIDFGTLVGLTVTGNIFSSYVNDGLLVNTNNGVVSQNSFLGTGQVAINKVGGNTVNATCNWFGSSLATTVAPKISGDVTYSPWLIDGTDNNAAVGFQTSLTCPVANSYYINDNNTNGDVFTTAVGSNTNAGTFNAPYASLEYAITQVPAGATIYLDAGIYTIPTINITKSVTILGPNHAVSPNNATNKAIYNTERNAEARLTGGPLNIGADWIFMNGLRFTPTTTAINMTGDYSHIKFNNNYFDVAGSFPTVLLQGTTSSPSIVAFDFMATDNRFERMDNGTGITLQIGNVRSLWVDNNTFIESGPIVNRSFGLRTINPSSVEGLAFTNNYLKKLNQAVNVFTLQNSTISSNKFDSTSQGIVYSPSNLVSNHVSINNNQFTNLRQGRAVLVRGGSNAGINNLNVSDNTINLEVNGTGGIVGLIQLEFAAANTFGTTNVIGNKINISGDYSQTNIGSNCGIILAGKHANTTVSFNELNFTAINAGLPLVLIALPPVPAGIFINTDGTSANGLIPASAVINIDNNKINGFKQSVAIYDPIAGITPEIGYGYLTTGATVNINNNSFTGDSLSIDNGITSQSVSATCNWFGTAAAQTILAKVSSNSAQVFPYLTDGTDTDAATGFQPTANTCDGSIPLITLSSFTNATCFGAANGTVNITASFGKAPFVFTWTKVGDANFISNDEDPTNFAAGTYRLAITDANGTTIYRTSVEGAVPDTLEVTITEPSIVTALITNTSTACSNIATVTAGGGTPGYTYLWSNGSTSPTISGVPAGTYSVTVTDANGCTATTSVTLTVSEAFNPSASVSNVTCFGANDGVITVTNINGTAPFMFSKDGGVSFETGSLPYSFINLAPGSYTIAVKDANGCVGFVERTVMQPTPLTATINTVQSTCFGASTGAINISVSGGVAAYSYSWTKAGGGFSSSQLNISGLAEGNYTLTVTDKNNCTYNVEVNVPTSPEIVVNESINHVTCRGEANGSITINASGGSNTNFSYLWNTGATTTTINNLPPGNYSVRVTDNGSGCFINKSFTITQPASVISLATAKTNATGCNSLGTITATGSGGTAPYTYSVNGAAVTGNSLGGLYAGDYNITVTDANGCTTSRLVTITDNGSDEYEGNNSKNQAKPISVGTTINARLALSNDASDWFTFTAPGNTSGLYSVKIVHPTAAYTVTVYASGKNTAALVPVSVINNGEHHYQLTAGATYFVSITTATLSYICYNFTVTAFEEGTATRAENKIASESTIEILNAFTYPNPHNGNFTLSIESPEEGEATVEIYTVNGQKLSERKANVVKGKGNAVKYSNMNYAILFYKVRIGKHVATGKIISPN